MVLLFLRDWRSALIIVLNIPVSLMAAVLALWVSRESINIMTLGGLALAVGILVDEATVTIENIHVHLGRGVPLARAAMDATSETAVPRLLAMLCVLAVFIPSFFMTGAARGLFVPLALAVGFSMVASYLLSSTLVPVLAVWVMRSRGHDGASVGNGEARRGGFERMRAGYARVVTPVVAMRWVVVPVYVVAALGVAWFVGRGLGQEIFPVVDAGQFQLRLRGPTGTRIEKTEQLYVRALDEVRAEVGAGNVAVSMGFVGTQPAAYPVNTIHLWTGGPEEGVMQVQLTEGSKIAIGPLKERLRARLAKALPEAQFSFEPSDIVSRVMSFGSPTPVEITVSGPSLAADRAYATKLKAALTEVPSLRDVQFMQAADYPTLEVNVDRQRAGTLGMTTADVMKSVVTSTWSSRFVAPNYWADPGSGVAYQVQVEVPAARMESAADVENLPIARPGGGNGGTGGGASGGGAPVLLKNLATVTPGERPELYSRYNMQRLVTLTANVQGEDLGTVSRRVADVIRRVAPPAKVTPTVRGQAPPLAQLLGELGTGLVLAVAVILLLLAANFQSWKLAVVVIATVPAVVAGVAVALWLTRTTLNVQSFMGAIMAIGVAVANAILLVTFAERRRMDGVGARVAAVEGAAGRLRPILMTSFAMIAGMVPMALGLGEGGEQTAPLGRAVVGGLVAATVATLLVLPAVFALVQGRAHTRSASLDPEDESGRHFAPGAAAAVARVDPVETVRQA
jgi:multidrug efflux pump subunit AcrB